MTTPLIQAIFTENTEEALRLIQEKDHINQALPSGKAPLHLAAERGQLEIVKALLENGANPKLTDVDNQTPLLLAEENNHAAIVELLRPLTATKKNAVHNINSNKMLLAAARDGKPDEVKAALTAGADVNYANEHGDTPLILACFNKHTAIAFFLLEARANVNCANKVNSTALAWASKTENPDLVHALLNAGADTNIASSNGWAPLSLAASHGYTDVVRLLLNPTYKTNINYVNPVNGRTSLIAAAAVAPDTSNVVNLLLAENMLPDVQDEEGKTALRWASERNAFNFTKALLEKGANPELADVKGETPISIAEKNKKTEMVALLRRYSARDANKNLLDAAEKGKLEDARAALTAGATIDCINHKGSTPLLFASQYGHIDIARLLLEAGANANAVNQFGVTGLNYACEKGHTAIVALLLEAEATANAVNQFGATGLIYACEKGHTGIVRLLLNPKHKVNINHVYPKLGRTALIFAAKFKHTEIVRLLLAKKDILVNLKDIKGKTALMWAREKGAKDIVNLLLEHKGKLRTPLMQALYNNDQAEALTLIANGDGADLNTQGEDGETALYLAAERGHLSVVDALLKKNANPNLARRPLGQTPLFIAAQCGNTEIVALLLEHQADPDLKFKEIYTPLEIAASKEKHETIKVLLHHAAAKNDNNHNKHQDLVNTINKVISVEDDKDFPHIRKGIRKQLVEVLKERAQLKIQSRGAAQIKAEIAGLENIRDTVVMLKKRDQKQKEKTAVVGINKLIAQLAHQRIQLEKTMTSSLIEAVTYLATSATKDRDNTAALYLLNAEMNDDQKTMLLEALKKLRKKQFDQLKNNLKDAIPTVQDGDVLCAEQLKLKRLFETQNDAVYNANPFLFILRTGMSEYEQKDTDSFTAVKNKILGTPLTNALKKMGFIPQKPKEPQQNVEVTRTNGIYDSL